ncbi:MAG TPA: ABC transporter permease [Gemmataceae bacterium]|nr:ABC transporter permease [Gemmataceae bacterium]
MTYILWILFGLSLGAGFIGVCFSDKGRRGLGLALRSLWLHKLRAFLSVLGIIIGTASVISLMSLGEGSMQDALEDIKRQGATNIIVRSVKPPDDSSTQRRTRFAVYGLTEEDYGRLLTIPTVIRNVPLRVFPQEIRHLARMANGRVVATTPAYADVHKFEVLAGRFLNEEDNHYMKNVAVLGNSVAQKLFPFDNPLEQTVRLGQHFYVVVGVLDDRMPTGGSGGSQAAEQFNDDVYIPLETCNRRFGQRIVIRTSGSFSGEQVELSQVTLTVKETYQVRPTGDVVRSLLARHLKNDWALTVPLDRLEEAERTQQRYEVLLFFIAGISLFVGGIGIMNIMLATVTERTREIGIRRALGAKRRDITLQFLIEAVAQTTLGGLIGMIFGLILVYAIPVCAQMFKSNVPAKLHVPSIFLSLAVSIVVGVLFGLYPAWRASRLDPIEALRHE